MAVLSLWTKFSTIGLCERIHTICYYICCWVPDQLSERHWSEPTVLLCFLYIILVDYGELTYEVQYYWNFGQLSSCLKFDIQIAISQLLAVAQRRDFFPDDPCLAEIAVEPTRSVVASIVIEINEIEWNLQNQQTTINSNEKFTLSSNDCNSIDFRSFSNLIEDLESSSSLFCCTWA